MSHSRKTLDFVYPPAVTAGDTVCYARLAEMGLGTGWGGVVNQHGGRLVRFRLPSVVLIHNVACVRCESIGFADGVHTARLPDGQVVGVRDVRDILAAAAGMKLYDADTAA